MIKKNIEIIINCLKYFFPKEIKEIRYIKHERIDPETFIVDHNLQYEMPTLYCGFTSKPFLMITGNYKPEKYLITKNIPSNIPIIKVPVPESSKAGVFYYSKDTIKIDFHIPRGAIEASVMTKAIIASIVKALGIDKKDFQLINNDLCIKTESGYKKFAGFFHCILGSDDYYAIPLSYNVDYDFMNKVFKLDTNKMKRKGNVKNMKDIIVGVSSAKNIKDRDTFLDDFAYLIAKRFNWELITSDFSKKEQQFLWKK